MVKKESRFVLVSLEDEKAKKLASILSSGAARRILDYLTSADSTESEIAKSLSMPISTVHYNLKLLVEGGLVDSESYHYSKKGREVAHYTLARKYIVIAPKNADSTISSLRHILPSIVGVIGIGLLLIFLKSNAPSAFKESTQESMAFKAEVTLAPMPLATEPLIIPWFFAGALLAIALVGISILFWRKR